MRILLTTHMFPPDGIAGVDRYTRLLATELASAGETVSIISRRPAPELYEPNLVRERLPQGIVLYRFVGGKDGWTSSLVHYDRLEQLFKAVLVETGAEVVHFNHLAHLSPHSGELARRLGVPVVHGIHDFFHACPLGGLQKRTGETCAGPEAGRECARTCFKSEGDQAGPRWGVRALYFRRLLQGGDYLICPSRFLADHIASLGVEPACLRVIPPGLRTIGPSSAAPVSFERPAALTLAFLGAVVPGAGLHVLLEALRSARVAVNLLVPGPLPYVDYATRVYEQARRIAGLNTRWRRASHLAGVDCVICPSLVPEPDGLGARQALAHGVPAIVSRLGGLPEWIVEGENGFTFPANQPAALAQLIRRLATENSLLKHLRTGAENTQIMTPAEHALAVRDVYRLAATNSRRGQTRRDSDRSEIDFLHAAMIDLGFAHST